jgi:hypothetical protein
MLCTSCISRDADSACGYHWQASWKLHASAYCLQRRWGIETKRVTVQVWTIWDSGTNSTSVGNRNNNAKMTSRHVWRLDYYCYLCYGGFCRNRSSSLFLTFSWFSSSHVYWTEEERMICIDSSWRFKMITDHYHRSSRWRISPSGYSFQ